MSTSPSSLHTAHPQSETPVPGTAYHFGLPERAALLRNTLRVNGIVSLAAGLALAIAPNAFADLLGTGHPGWVRVVGVVTALLGVDYTFLSTRPERDLRRYSPLVIAGDDAWVIASIATIAAGWYSGVGNALVAASAVMVGSFAILQFRGWRRIR